MRTPPLLLVSRSLGGLRRAAAILRAPAEPAPSTKTVVDQAAPPSQSCSPARRPRSSQRPATASSTRHSTTCGSTSRSASRSAARCSPSRSTLSTASRSASAASSCPRPEARHQAVRAGPRQSGMLLRPGRRAVRLHPRRNGQGETAEYTIRPVAVTGTFDIQRNSGPDGRTWRSTTSPAKR